MIIFRAKTEIEKTFAENTRADDLNKISKFNDKNILRRIGTILLSFFPLFFSPQSLISDIINN